MKAGRLLWLFLSVGLTFLAGCNDSGSAERQDQQGDDGASVQQPGPFQSLARWLPAAGSARLEGLSICLEPADCRRAGRLVPGNQTWLRLLLLRLGFTSLAQASYRYGSKPGDWLLVVLASGTSAEPGLAEVLEALRERQVPPRRLRRKRATNRDDDAGEVEQPDSDVMQLLAWAGKDAPRMERLWLGRRKQPGRRRVARDLLWRARAAALPEKAGIWLVLFRAEASLRELLGRWGGDQARSLAASEELELLLAQLPEVLPENEQPVLLERGPFRLAWPLLPRRARWARPLLDLPANRLAFAGGEFPWEVNRVECSDDRQARQAFELGFVKPRKDRLQRLLERSRTVHYDMGLRLVELGQARAWHFRGGARGRQQLLYFRKGAQIVWLAAPQGGELDPQVEQLVERLELLEE